MELTPWEADILSKAWKAVREAMDAMEQIRPAGGFREAIDRTKYCPCCGRPRDG